MLDAPAEDTIAGLRDRAILSVGLQVGLRRAEIAALKVGDLHQNRGFDSLRVSRKGGRRGALAINPQTAARLRAYLEAHPEPIADINGPPLGTVPGILGNYLYAEVRGAERGGKRSGKLANGA